MKRQELPPYLLFKDEYAMVGTPSLSPLKNEHETTGNNYFFST
jgi:hypothetical protein